MANSMTTPLTGKALLQKIKELSHLNKREQARQCGYLSSAKGTSERVQLTEFYEAIVEAIGYKLDPDHPKDGRGREPTYRVSVHKNGQIVIGAAYTRAMNLSEGDEFEIKLGYKHIHLKQIDPEK
jgi:AbrB family looped-hinge helix DNA binding protein